MTVDDAGAAAEAAKTSSWLFYVRYSSWKGRVFVECHPMRRALSSATATTRYCPRSHAWLRIMADARCRIGLTRRGLEDVGEATAIEFSSPVGHRECSVDAVLFGIDWEAMKISDGDELYHTTWANITGRKRVYWPVSGTVASVNEALSVPNIEEKDWLVELILDCDLQSTSLLTESEYLKVVQEQGPGLFGDEDDAARLGYTSYG